MFRRWNPGNKKKHIYRYVHDLHKNRIGNCNWKPMDGDLCLCIDHTGDCFNDYLVIRKQSDGRYMGVGEFGAYAFGTSCGSLDTKTFHVVQAGYKIDFIPD